ncbi:NAD-dependent deacetylase [Salipaludibacillus sp. CUR1]|uniref:SIR2 family NAD-dependent protein deacylase n=1 Tax=Salipaludibacillus sp. CUR1 TaxID=2820003 RepID=UPI00351D9A03
MVSVKDWQELLTVGTENEHIKISGKEKKNGEWVFKRTVNGDSLERGYLSPREGNEVTGWDNALRLLDGSPLRSLHILKADPLIYPYLGKYMLTSKNIGEELLLAWSDKVFPGKNKDMVMAAKWLLGSDRAVILSGAGMSTESNIPDFRSSSGWWKQIDPRTVATVEALDSNYDLFQEFYATRMKALDQIEPHEGHRVLAKWEENNLVQLIGTQNVDGLHSAAGSLNVQELHGSIRSIRCHDCGKEGSIEAFTSHETCSRCGGRLRPAVVLFGEMLPQEAWETTLEAIEQAGLVIVIGTSMEVYPANQLPAMTSGKTVYINAETAETGAGFDLIIEGKAKKTLQNINELIEIGIRR